MPAIHGSLKDADFDIFGKIAESKDMTRTELVTALVLAEIHKFSNTEK
ncbi:MAG: hypothetical protein M0Q91_12640 [Methanoregula sp.]|jgi:hypothetical protein|nr:hypothetical protein [Methanoregula sp.]